jgi:hypothetical protein
MRTVVPILFDFGRSDDAIGGGSGRFFIRGSIRKSWGVVNDRNQKD